MNFTKQFTTKYGTINVNFNVVDGAVNTNVTLPEGVVFVNHDTGYYQDGSAANSANKAKLISRGDIEKYYICFAPVANQGKKHRAFLRIGCPELVNIVRPMPSLSQADALDDFLNTDTTRAAGF
jgi:hypothetical protein